MPYSLFLKKQNFKFSSSHFTIFNKDAAEGLHGHNYQVALRAEFAEVQEDTDLAVDFNPIKKSVRALCENLDEKILIPKNSPYLKITESLNYKNHLEVHFNDRHYCFPEAEVHLLDATNITSESLARVFHKSLQQEITAKTFSITIFETAGQAATYIP